MSDTTTAPVSRNDRQHERDKWLLKHADLLTKLDIKIIAIAMKDLGLFSPKTGLGDVRTHVVNRCKKLGLKLKEIERK